MAFLRNTLYILLLLLVIAVLAITAIVMLVDPNKIKPVIVDEVKKYTGFNLTIHGSISWSVYPLLGIKLERMTLSVPAQTKPFADLYGVTLATQLMQLMHGQQKLLGNVYISQAELLNIHAQKVTIKIQWLDKFLTLPVTASLYDGWLEGVVQGDNLKTQPRWSWGMQLTRVQLNPLLADVNGDSSKLSVAGRAQIRMEGNTYGKTRQELISRLNGNIKYDVTDGAVQGIDLNYLLQTADALISKKPIALPSPQQQTTFESMNGTGFIHDGIFTTNNTVLISSNFTTKTTGNIDLINDTIDLQLDLRPVNLEKLKYAIPVDVTGSLSHPAVNLDTIKMNSILATEQVEKVKAKVKEQIKQLPSKIDNFISKVLKK